MTDEERRILYGDPHAVRPVGIITSARRPRDRDRPSPERTAPIVVGRRWPIPQDSSRGPNR